MKFQFVPAHQYLYNYTRSSISLQLYPLINIFLWHFFSTVLQLQRVVNQPLSERGAPGVENLVLRHSHSEQAGHLIYFRDRTLHRSSLSCNI